MTIHHNGTVHRRPTEALTAGRRGEEGTAGCQLSLTEAAWPKPTQGLLLQDRQRSRHWYKRSTALSSASSRQRRSLENRRRAE